MSSSGEIPNNLNDTLDDADEEALQPVVTKKTIGQRGKGAFYFPYCSFFTLQIAIETLKNQFMETVWTQKNTIEQKNGHIIWFKCKFCDIKLKVVLINNSPKGVTIETSPEEHQHPENSNNLVTIGIPDAIKRKIIELDKLSKLT